MRLSKEDTDLFYKLNWSLLFYVNKKHPVIQGINTPDFKNQDFSKIAEIHEKIHSNPGLIDAFCAENPFNFNQEELDIIKSWKNFVIFDSELVSIKLSRSNTRKQEASSASFLLLILQLERIKGLIKNC